MKSAGTKRKLSPKQGLELLGTLKARFEKHVNRHSGLEWVKVKTKLEANSGKLWSLNEMEESGGEPDVVGDGRVFVGYNGAHSYYAARAFRGSLRF